MTGMAFALIGHFRPSFYTHWQFRSSKSGLIHPGDCLFVLFFYLLLVIAVYINLSYILLPYLLVVCSIAE